MGGQIQLLLDTHALLWWLTRDARLSAAASTLISDESNSVHVSPVSAVEIAIKHRLGRLPHAAELISRFHELMDERGFRLLTLSVDHGFRAGGYPGDHRDPFDRLLAAQAELDELILLTRDPAFAAFPCETLW
ncbi:MAG TPA: type II toxin-antitoxin system VapC family toxin [Allosphingosinicella sp.]